MTSTDPPGSLRWNRLSLCFRGACTEPPPSARTDWLEKTLKDVAEQSMCKRRTPGQATACGTAGHSHRCLPARRKMSWAVARGCVEGPGSLRKLPVPGPEGTRWGRGPGRALGQGWRRRGRSAAPRRPSDPGRSLASDLLMCSPDCPKSISTKGHQMVPMPLTETTQHKGGLLVPRGSENGPLTYHFQGTDPK